MSHRARRRFPISGYTKQRRNDFAASTQLRGDREVCWLSRAAAIAHFVSAWGDLAFAAKDAKPLKNSPVALAFPALAKNNSPWVRSSKNDSAGRGPRKSGPDGWRTEPHCRIRERRPDCSSRFENRFPQNRLDRFLREEIPRSQWVRPDRRMRHHDVFWMAASSSPMRRSRSPAISWRFALRKSPAPRQKRRR